MKRLVAALCALGLLAGSAPALAGSACRDKAGKFVKCPPKPAAAKTCRDAKGHFTKCK